MTAQTTGIRARRRLFFRRFNLKDRHALVLYPVASLVGHLAGGLWGAVIGLAMSLVLHFGVPWIGGHFIGFAAQAPVTTLKADVKATGPEDQDGSP